MSVILLLYQINIYLFTSSAAAAVHNLCEWSIVLHMAGNHKELKKYLPMVSFFIAFLVTLCMCVPNLFIALGLEQSFGMMLDFGMPVMFTMQLFDQEKRKIYLLPLLIQVSDENICLTLRFCPFCMYILQ